MSSHQRTLRQPVSVEGIGVHSGAPATLRFSGADADTGVVFRRIDLDGEPVVPAVLDRVVDTELGTTLGEGEVRVQTVEHVMAALSAVGVDNAVVELSGPEPPILDGGFLPYVEALEAAGLVEQDRPARTISLSRPVHVEVGDGTEYHALPDPDFRISATIDFEHPAIGLQKGHFRVPDAFREEIAPARTFGFHRDAETLRARGLALGASLDNTVVLDEHGVVNVSLRFPDEFVRHKVGDLVGDLALLGGRMHGYVVARRPSHRGNIELARAILTRGNHSQEPVLDVQKLMDYLPHRYPFLLVDRILEFEPEKRIVGLKNVTINEPFFQGHFPGHPIMPGVLLVEAMAQVGGLLLMESEEDPSSKVVYFVSMDNVKFRKPVLPGDQVIFELEMLQFKRRICKIRGVGRVDGKTVVEGDLTASVQAR